MRGLVRGTSILSYISRISHYDSEVKHVHSMPTLLGYLLTKFLTRYVTKFLQHPPSPKLHGVSVLFRPRSVILGQS
jgi:hypothetical protein